MSPQESNIGCIRYEEDSSVQVMMLEDQLVHLHELLLFPSPSISLDGNNAQVFDSYNIVQVRSILREWFTGY